jgi:hypothetical protein
MGINITCPASMDRPLIQSGQWKQNKYLPSIHYAYMQDECVLYDPRLGGF